MSSGEAAAAAKLIPVVDAPPAARGGGGGGGRCNAECDRDKCGGTGEAGGAAGDWGRRRGRREWVQPRADA